MSKRSRRRHRQPGSKADTLPSATAPTSTPEPAAAPAPTARGGTKGRAILIGTIVVVVAAALYAVTARSKRNGADPAAGGSNTVAGLVPKSGTSAAPLSGAASSATAPFNPAIGPRIAFGMPVYDFGTVKSGEIVKYTYVFTNTGGGTLILTNVQTSCGCTTAGDYTKQVEPGRTGTIPIQFNTAGYGSSVIKAITVTCNDTNQMSAVLEIKGTVWKPINVAPEVAVLNVTSESPSNGLSLHITSMETNPLTLSPPESTLPSIAAELITNQPGKDFQLIIKTVPPLPTNNVAATITMKTSSTNVPTLLVNAWVNMQPVVAVAPSLLSLPPTPVTNPVPAVVSIINYGTNLLTLSDPMVNAKGVDVHLMELQPGRNFTLTMTFPPGFEIAQGEKVEFSVKSNHPHYPVIKIPVVQQPRPAPPVVPAATSAPPVSVKQ